MKREGPMKKIQFDNQKNIIARQLKASRLRAGMSQEQLAAKMQLMGVNIDQQMISKIERNDRIVTDYELACFSIVLKTDISLLLSDFSVEHNEQ